jgi:hypothetical protein
MLLRDVARESASRVFSSCGFVQGESCSCIRQSDKQTSRPDPAETASFLWVSISMHFNIADLSVIDLAIPKRSIGMKRHSI